MRTDRELMMQALEALEDSNRIVSTMIGNSLMREPSMFDRTEVCKYVRGWFRTHHVKGTETAIAALRERLEQPEDAPVAWMYEWDGKKHLTFTDQCFIEKAFPHFNKSQALYTRSQPQQIDHITDGKPCWCGPEVTEVDPVTGASVVVHKDDTAHHAEQLARLGWQYFECPACGSQGARAFPVGSPIYVADVTMPDPEDSPGYTDK